MKRYKDIEGMLKSGSLDDEEILMLNETTLLRNLAESNRKDLQKSHEHMVIPLMKDSKIIRRVGIYEKKDVKKTEVDVALMKDEVQSEKFLIIPLDCVGATLFEKDEDEEESSSSKPEGGPYQNPPPQVHKPD